MRFKLFILLPVILLSYASVSAQANASMEASVNLGFTSFQTDYGEDGNFKSSFTGNMGYAVGGSLYVNFFNTNPSVAGYPNWLQKHLKLKLEVSYLSAKLEHFGDNVGDRDHMKGLASVINFGTVLEYHPFVLPDFVPGIRKKLTPYVGFGVMGTFAMPKVETNQSSLIKAYQIGDDGFKHADDAPVFTYSLMPSGGLRYQLDNGNAIMMDMRWQYFGSDFIDGLSPNNDVIDGANKHNDWLYYFNVGYVIKFGENARSSTWGN